MDKWRDFQMERILIPWKGYIHETGNMEINLSKIMHNIFWK